MKRLFFFLALAMSTASFGDQPWGKDADLCAPRRVETAKKEPGPVAWIADKLILFHQKVISPADGPRSHYVPSSSQYTREAIQKHGFLVGWVMGCDRLMRENRDMWIYRQVQKERLWLKWDPPP